MCVLYIYIYIWGIPCSTYNIYIYAQISKPFLICCWSIHHFHRISRWRLRPLRSSSISDTPRFIGGYSPIVIITHDGSMYAIYGDIYHQYTPNVSIYTSTMDPMGYDTEMVYPPTFQQPFAFWGFIPGLILDGSVITGKILNRKPEDVPIFFYGFFPVNCSLNSIHSAMAQVIPVISTYNPIYRRYCILSHRNNQL